MGRALRLATRSSPLAVAQAGQVARLLGAAGYESELVRIAPAEEAGPVAAGDDGGSETTPSDKGRFVRGVEQALLDARADIAVHSAKDLPSDLMPGLVIAGTPTRAAASDAWIPAQDAAPGEIPRDARVGTSSHRRRSQLLAVRPDLVIEELRGNVDTRLRLVAERGLDGAVLATAGLERLGRQNVIGFRFDSAAMLPAAGQGALALEVRQGNEEAAKAVDAISDSASLAELTAERALVAVLEADCDTPVAALAVVENGQLTIEAYAGSGDGSDWIRDRVIGSATNAVKLGTELAERMLSAGAAEVMKR